MQKIIFIYIVTLWLVVIYKEIKNSKIIFSNYYYNKNEEHNLGYNKLYFVIFLSYFIFDIESFKFIFSNMKYLIFLIVYICIGENVLINSNYLKYIKIMKLFLVAIIFENLTIGVHEMNSYFDFVLYLHPFYLISAVLLILVVVNLTLVNCENKMLKNVLAFIVSLFVIFNFEIKINEVSLFDNQLGLQLFSVIVSFIAILNPVFVILEKKNSSFFLISLYLISIFIGFLGTDFQLVNNIQRNIEFNNESSVYVLFLILLLNIIVFRKEINEHLKRK